MVRERECLPFGVEPSQYGFAVDTRLDHFERYLSADPPLLFRDIDRPHTSIVDDFSGLVGSHLVPGLFCWEPRQFLRPIELCHPARFLRQQRHPQ